MYVYEIKYQNGICDVMDDLAKIDKDFKKIGIVIPHRKNQIIICLIFAILYLISSLLFIFDITAYKKKMVSFTRKLLVIVYLIPLMANLRMGLSVSIFMGLIKQRFEKINNLILTDIKSFIKYKNTSRIIYVNE